MFKKVEGIYTAAKQAFKKNPNPGAAIKSVKTNVPDTKLKKLQAANTIAKQRLKGAEAKLKQTNFELANKAFKKDDKFTFEDMMIQEGGTGISPFMAAKGGRAGYGKGGKVSRGCGKVMAGRNKKTKYI